MLGAPCLSLPLSPLRTKFRVSHRQSVLAFVLADFPISEGTVEAAAAVGKPGPKRIEEKRVATMLRKDERGMRGLGWGYGKKNTNYNKNHTIAEAQRTHSSNSNLRLSLGEIYAESNK